MHLLNQPGGREAAVALTDLVAADLTGLPGSDATVNQWRVLLAFHAGRAGYPAASHRLLAPVISSGTTAQQEAAQAMLRVIGGPRADTRLQIIILEAELAATPSGAEDDLLRLHCALAMDYDTLGDYRSALRHGTNWVDLSLRLLGHDHRQELYRPGMVLHRRLVSYLSRRQRHRSQKRADRRLDSLPRGRSRQFFQRLAFRPFD